MIPKMTDEPERTPTSQVEAAEQAATSPEPTEGASLEVPTPQPPLPEEAIRPTAITKKGAVGMLPLLIGTLSLLVGLGSLGFGFMVSQKLTLTKTQVSGQLQALFAQVKAIPAPKDFSGDSEALRTDSNKRLQALESYVQQVLPQEIQKITQLNAALAALEEKGTSRVKEVSMALQAAKDTISKHERNLTNVVQILRNHDRALQMIYESQAKQDQKKEETPDPY